MAKTGHPKETYPDSEQATPNDWHYDPQIIDRESGKPVISKWDSSKTEAIHEGETVKGVISGDPDLREKATVRVIPVTNGFQTRVTGVSPDEFDLLGVGGAVAVDAYSSDVMPNPDEPMLAHHITGNKARGKAH